MAVDTLTSGPGAVYRETQTGSWTCARCGARLDSGEPLIMQDGAHYCLACSPVRGLVRRAVKLLVGPPIDPADDATVEAMVAEAQAGQTIRPLRALTPEQEAAIREWREVHHARRASELLHLRDAAEAERGEESYLRGRAACVADPSLLLASADRARRPEPARRPARRRRPARSLRRGS